MKTLLLNLPHKDKIIRRFMCSYNSPGFLFPPNELLSLGGIVRDWKKSPVELIDSIAEKLDLAQTIEKIGLNQPDIIVSLTGLECFQDDIEVLQKIKSVYPAVKVLCFGYYPTLFAQDILNNTDIDFILLNEPEMIFSELYDILACGGDPRCVKGLVYKENGRVYVNPAAERIADLDRLPPAFHGLLNKTLYSEAFFGGPLTTIQSSRGCSFSCNYCVRTYGRKVYYRSPENVVSEIDSVAGLGIRKIRFLDDTFNLDKKRAADICSLIIDRNLEIEWTCLSRVDTLDGEVLKLMKRSGCRRIYLGIESGSQKILDYYQKGYRLDSMKSQVKLIRGAGIETAAFFIVGAPVETERDLKDSVRFSKSLGLDYVIVGKLTPYPGTPLFEKNEDKMDFQSFPYKNRFKDVAWEEEILRREKFFYFHFYCRPGYLIPVAGKMLCRPHELAGAAVDLLSFLISRKKKEHKNYL